MDKKTLIEAKDEIIDDEGVMYIIYRDHLGHRTFGVGHLITENDPEYYIDDHSNVSEERVKEAFENDIAIALYDCKKLYDGFYEWPSEVQKVMLNMMFNLGRSKMSRFVRMNAALKDRDWKTASKEGRDSLWYRQVPNRAKRLMDRLERCYLLYE